MRVRAAVEELGGKQLPLVERMPRLSAWLAFGLAVGRGRGRGLDEVGGRRLGGGRGILPSARQLFLEVRDRRREECHLRLQGSQLLPQPLAFNTRSLARAFHAVYGTIEPAKWHYRRESLLDFQEAILMANAERSTAHSQWLVRADGRLVCLRALLRLAFALQLLGGNQVKYAAERVDELGRLLGAWKKGTDRSALARSA
jgi:hypothetical protein